MRRKHKAALATGDANNNKPAPKRTTPSKASGDGQKSGKKAGKATEKAGKVAKKDFFNPKQKEFNCWKICFKQNKRKFIQKSLKVFQV